MGLLGINSQHQSHFANLAFSRSFGDRHIIRAEYFSLCFVPTEYADLRVTESPASSSVLLCGVSLKRREEISLEIDFGKSVPTAVVELA